MHCWRITHLHARTPLYRLNHLDYVFICAFLTIAFLLTLMYVKSFEHFNQFWKVTVLIGILMTTGSYLMIGLSNPGIIPIVEPFVEDEDIGYQPHYCRFCKKNKPAGARHCTECGICIRGHDHHCVWIGKCAGEGNIYRFYFFVLSLFSTFIVFFIASISSTPLKSTGY